jgi:hypothetical protein
MSGSMRVSRFGCRCGEVAFEAAGEPIMTVTCHCGSCRKAAADFAALPGAPQVANAEGGTDFVMMRKDRIRCVHGADLLRAHRLTPQAPTRRVLTGCCDTPMFLEFKGGHWLSVYRDRLAEAPAIEMRTMVGDRKFTDGIPSYRTHSAKFMWRLLKAWAAMGFRVPKMGPIQEA